MFRNKDIDVSWLELKYNDVLNAVERGNEKAKTKLAWLMLSGTGGAVVDEDAAVVLLEERVKDRDTDAMWILGACYEYGMGTQQDIQHANDLYKQSSNGGNKIGAFLMSCEWLGRGSGVMKMNSL